MLSLRNIFLRNALSNCTSLIFAFLWCFMFVPFWDLTVEERISFCSERAKRRATHSLKILLFTLKFGFREESTNHFIGPKCQTRREVVLILCIKWSIIQEKKRLKTYTVLTVERKFKNINSFKWIENKYNAIWYCSELWPTIRVPVYDIYVRVCVLQSRVH